MVACFQFGFVGLKRPSDYTYASRSCSERGFAPSHHRPETSDVVLRLGLRGYGRRGRRHIIPGYRLPVIIAFVASSRCYRSRESGFILVHQESGFDFIPALGVNGRPRSGFRHSRERNPVPHHSALSCACAGCAICNLGRWKTQRSSVRGLGACQCARRPADTVESDHTNRDNYDTRNCFMGNGRTVGKRRILGGRALDQRANSPHYSITHCKLWNHSFDQLCPTETLLTYSESPEHSLTLPIGMPETAHVKIT